MYCAHITVVFTVKSWERLMCKARTVRSAEMVSGEIYREIGGFDSKTGQAWPDPNSPAIAIVNGDLCLMELEITADEGVTADEGIRWMSRGGVPENYKLPMRVVMVGVYSEISALTV